MYRKIFGISICICLLTGIGALTACSLPITEKDPDSIYSAEFSYSPWEYATWLNKEIEVVTNELTTQMILAQSYINGSYPASQAVASAESSLTIINEACAQVTTMRPPRDYTQNREETIRLMNNAANDIQAYINALNSGGNVSGCKDKMLADNTAITAQFNNNYK